MATHHSGRARRRGHPRAGGRAGGEQLGLQPGAVQVPEEVALGARPVELPPYLQGADDDNGQY